MEENLLFWCFLISQHVSGNTPPIVRSTKTAIAASGFTYIVGCSPLRWLTHHSGRQPKMNVKPEAAITVFELLTMGVVSPETCWAIKKHWNNTFYYTVASFWFFLWDLIYWSVCSLWKYSLISIISRNTICIKFMKRVSVISIEMRTH